MKKGSTAAKQRVRNISGQTLTIGLDLGDRNSWYCVLDEAGRIQLEQRVRTNAKALQEVFGAMPRNRIALEIGTHSPWVSRLLSELGHGVVVDAHSVMYTDPFGAPYPLVAVYLGDARNLSSPSVVLSQHVLQAKTAARVSSSANPSGAGQAVTFTATITSPTVTPTGPVTFTAGKQVLGTAQIVPWSHKATLTIATLPVGSTTIGVTYLGNSNVARSSAVLTQTVR